MVTLLLVRRAEPREDADFLKPFEDKGEAVELQDEDARTVNLKVIEKKSVGTE